MTRPTLISPQHTCSIARVCVALRWAQMDSNHRGETHYVYSVTASTTRAYAPPPSAEGIEPPSSALKAVALPLSHAPLLPNS